MDQQFFESENKKYNDIQIPDSLDFKVRQSIKLAKKKRKSNTAFKVSTAIAAVLAVFIITVNASPQVAKALSSVPLLDKFIAFITLDKGLENAVQKGEYQEINYTAEQNGVKLTITSIAGDRRHIWVGYRLEGKGKLNVSPRIVDAQSNLPLSSIISFPGTNEKEESYYEIGIDEWKEYSNEIKLICEVYKNKTYYNEDGTIHSESNEFDRNNIVATFEIPITLDKKIFKTNTAVIGLEDKELKTDIGILNFYKLTTSTTRTTLEFSLDSEEYKFMSFYNPRLVDSSGKIYSTASSYSSSTGEGRNKIDFQGEISKDSSSLTFKCDGIYYIRAKEDYIVVDFKNKVIEPNSFGFKLIGLQGNQLTIGSDNVSSVSFSDTKDNEGNIVAENDGVSARESNGKRSVEAYFNLKNVTDDKIRLPIFWILDENRKTKSYSIEISAEDNSI